jgi:hypothetical protein
MMAALKPKLILPLISLLALALLAGCKKTVVLPIERISDNTWSLDGKHFVTASNRIITEGEPESEIVFQDSYVSDLAILVIIFKNIPTSSGTYKLIRDTLEPLGDKEMNLVSKASNTGSCTYIGEVIDIQITVTDGKVKLTIPEINMKSYDPSKPVYKLSAAVYEM